MDFRAPRCGTRWTRSGRRRTCEFRQRPNGELGRFRQFGCCVAHRLAPVNTKCILSSAARTPLARTTRDLAAMAFQMFNEDKTQVEAVIAREEPPERIRDWRKLDAFLEKLWLGTVGVRSEVTPATTALIHLRRCFTPEARPA